MFKEENLCKVGPDSDKTYSFTWIHNGDCECYALFFIYIFTVKVDQPLRRSALQEGEDTFTQSVELTLQLPILTTVTCCLAAICA